MTVKLKRFFPPSLKSCIYLFCGVRSIFYHKRLHEPSVDAAHTSHLPPLVFDGLLLLLLLNPTLSHHPTFFFFFSTHTANSDWKQREKQGRKKNRKKEEKIHGTRTKCTLMCVCETAGICVTSEKMLLIPLGVAPFTLR